MFVLYVMDDPVAGFELIGPFEDGNDAQEYAEKELRNSTWYILKLTAPEAI